MSSLPASPAAPAKSGKELTLRGIALGVLLTLPFTAAILMLALDEIGASDVALYDGSWTEWGARPQAPVETG